MIAMASEPNEDDVGQRGGAPRTKVSTSLGTAVSEGYVNWTLFLSSYAPLLLIFAVRLSDKHPSAAFWACVVAGLATLNLLLLLNVRVAPRDFSIKTVQRGDSQVAAYIATYLLPFLVVSDLGWRDFLAYGLLVLFVGIIMTRDQVLHVNPLLALLGFRLTSVTTADDVEYFVLSRRRLRSEQVIRVVQVRARLLLER